MITFEDALKIAEANKNAPKLWNITEYPDRYRKRMCNA